MSIVRKINRSGIDVVIDGLQQMTYAKLLGFWADGIEFTMYPRANKNYRRDSLIPEISLDSKDYKETLYDDKVSVNCFFLADDESTYQYDNNQVVQDVSIIFQGDLVKLYADTERVDEVFNQHVLQVFKDVRRYITSDISRTTGVDNVYSDLNLTTDLKEKIQYSNISNRHVLKLDFSVRYNFRCNDAVIPACVPVSIVRDGVLIERVEAGGEYRYESGSYDYDLFFDGVDTGENVTVDGTDITINLR